MSDLLNVSKLLAMGIAGAVVVMTSDPLVELMCLFVVMLVSFSRGVTLRKEMDDDCNEHS